MVSEGEALREKARGVRARMIGSIGDTPHGRTGDVDHHVAAGRGGDRDRHA